MIGLETDRIIFREWREEDYPAFKTFFSQPEATKFIGGVQSPESAWRLMTSYLGHYSLKGYSYLALEEKSNGQWLGSMGLWNSPPWPELELGYWLLPNAQGKGYGTEAGLALKKYARKELKLASLVSYIATDNLPSKKLAERLGAKFDSNLELLSFGPHEVYRYW